MQSMIMTAQAAAVQTPLFQQSMDLLKTKPGEVLAAGAFVMGILLGVVLAFALAKAFCKCATPSAKKDKPFRRESSRKFDRPAPQPRPVLPAGSVEIYVGNLSYDLTEDGLRKEFEAFGKVETARVVANRFNNRSKGFGFVVMPNRAEAEKAIAAMNDKEVLGRTMRVNEAKNTIKEEA